MMRFNLRVGPVRTQMTNMQKMNNYDMIMQKIPNLHVCSSDDSESKRINADNSESKRVIVNTCSTDERK